MKLDGNDNDPNTTEAEANIYAKHTTNYMKLLSKTLSFVFNTNVSSHKINKILQNISKSPLLYKRLDRVKFTSNTMNEDLNPLQSSERYMLSYQQNARIDYTNQNYKNKIHCQFINVAKKATILEIPLPQ